MMKNKSLLRTAAVWAVGLVSLSMQAREYKLWYDKPAAVWTEALPLGNGRLGAMVFGTPGVEQIQLNEETIWQVDPITTPTPMLWSTSPRYANWSLPASTSKHKPWLRRR